MKVGGWPTAVRDVLIGGACAGIGVATARLPIADSGDVLAFAGALIGAGATVGAAFAVAERSDAARRAAARQMLVDIAEGVEADMAFMERVMDFDLGEFAGVEDDVVTKMISDRLDHIVAGLPETSEFLRTERLGSQASDIAVLAVERRMVGAFGAAEDHFRALRNKRRASRQAEGEKLIPYVQMPSSASVRELRSAMQSALAALGIGQKEHQPTPSKAAMSKGEPVRNQRHPPRPSAGQVEPG